MTFMQIDINLTFSKKVSLPLRYTTFSYRTSNSPRPLGQRNYFVYYLN